MRAALGQLAVHPADWPEVEEHASASARLAEREGLSGQLCLPLLLQGISAWRLGDWQAAEASLERSHSVAAAGGRSEAAFSALLWLGACEADRGDHKAACETFIKAAEICDRAGLIAQSAEAFGARAAVIAMHGTADEAREAAEGVEQVLKGAAHPVGLAAAAEARGAVGGDAAAAALALREAVAAWEQAGRPINAIRTRLLLARALQGSEDRSAATGVLEEAATAADQLDIAHLAAAARAELTRV